MLLNSKNNNSVNFALKLRKSSFFKKLLMNLTKTKTLSKLPNKTI